MNNTKEIEALREKLDNEFSRYVTEKMVYSNIDLDKWEDNGTENIYMVFKDFLGSTDGRTM